MSVKKTAAACVLSSFITAVGVVSLYNNKGTAVNFTSENGYAGATHVLVNAFTASDAASYEVKESLYNHAIYNAAYNGYIDDFDSYIQRIYNQSRTDALHSSGLKAAANNQVEMVHHILEKYASDLNINYLVISATNEAARYGHTEFVLSFVDRFEPFFTEESMMHLVQSALEQGQTHIASTLVEKYQLDISEMSLFDLIPTTASGEIQDDRFEKNYNFLSEHLNGTQNWSAADVQSAILHSFHYNKPSVARVLFEEGYSLSHEDMQEALYYALFEKKNAEAVELLLDMGVDPRASKWMNDPAATAERYGFDDIAKEMRERALSYDVQDLRPELN